jgi:glycosyltransferase involved in cell wall biosynthesis
LNGSDRIIAPSQSYRNDVAKVFQTLDQKIESIHNGVNFDEMARPSGDSDTDKLDYYLLCIAMHNEKKGLDVLLRAFAIIENVEPQLKLALVGDGPLRADLEALAMSLGISGKVRFLGRKGRPQVVRLMQRCEIFVLPSRAEPFGLVLIEAMACKKPVIATKVGGIPEIVEDGRSGMLVEPDNPNALAEALVTMLQNRDLRLSMANNGYAAVHEKFSSEAMASGYELLFADVLRSR